MLTSHSTSWFYWGEVYSTIESMIIPTWFDAVHNRWPNFKLVIEDASNKMRHQTTLLTKVLLKCISQAMLSTHLVSFEVKDLSRHLNFDDEKKNLKKILVKSFKLREVRLNDKSAYRFHTYRHISERLSSLKRLHLCDYLWTLSMRNVSEENANWDTFSLTHLELRKLNTRFFFHSVSLFNFSHLRSFKMNTWSKLDDAVSLDLMKDER